MREECMHCHSTEALVYHRECDHFVCRECMKPKEYRHKEGEGEFDADFDTFFGRVVTKTPGHARN